MEGILALMIPVLAMATGLVAMIRTPRENLGRRRRHDALPAADNQPLLEEIAALREELAQVRDRVDFTERLLMDAAPAPRLSASVAADPRVPAAAAGTPSMPSVAQG